MLSCGFSSLRYTAASNPIDTFFLVLFSLYRFEAIFETVWCYESNRIFVHYFIGQIRKMHMNENQPEGFECNRNQKREHREFLCWSSSIKKAARRCKGNTNFIAQTRRWKYFAFKWFQILARALNPEHTIFPVFQSHSNKSLKNTVFFLLCTMRILL